MAAFACVNFASTVCAGRAEPKEPPRAQNIGVGGSVVTVCCTVHPCNSPLGAVGRVFQKEPLRYNNVAS